MKRHKIKKPYLLYVGNAYPHKNLERLLQSFKLVEKQQVIGGLYLILVGRIDHFYQRLQKLSKELDLGKLVIFTGQVSDEDLRWLYRNALAYVFPSLSEGFGLPGLEAMKEGLVVASSNRGVLPEIYGRAAIYFDPENISEMAMVILKVVSDDALRRELKETGYARVKRYSWKKCAQETLNVYKSVE